MIAAESVVLIIIVLVWSALLVTGVRGARAIAVVRPVDGAVLVEVTAFMPARNEAEVIERAVDGVLAQEGLRHFVAIDDGSTDGTKALLDSRAGEVLSVLSGSGPGKGECGKPAALWSAYRSAEPKSPWLLFVDADVILEPGALHGLLSYAERSGADLVSVLPRLTLSTPIEKIVMPSIGALIVSQHSPARIADPKSPTAFANGQVILIRRELYERIGGHHAVVREILEDVRLAELAKRAGGQLALVDGRRIAATRMYDGWRELREGWTKNLFPLLGSNVIKTLLLATFGVLIGNGGWIAVAIGGAPEGVAILVYVTAVQMYLRHLGSASAMWAVFAPLGAVVTAFVMLESLWRHKFGRTLRWKGRSY